jgi:outer membrane cobalamin receptor
VSDSALDNDLLPLHARLIASASLALTSPPWPAARLDGARLEARFSQRSSRVADPAGLIQLPERRDLELGASLAFFDHASLSARVANALDDRSVDLIGYPLPGRSFHVEVSSWF